MKHALALCSLVVLATLVGCGGREETKPATDLADTPPPAAQAVEPFDGLWKGLDGNEEIYAYFKGSGESFEGIAASRSSTDFSHDDVMQLKALEQTDEKLIVTAPSEGDHRVEFVFRDGKLVGSAEGEEITLEKVPDEQAAPIVAAMRKALQEKSTEKSATEPAEKPAAGPKENIDPRFNGVWRAVDMDESIRLHFAVKGKSFQGTAANMGDDNVPNDVLALKLVRSSKGRITLTAPAESDDEVEFFFRDEKLIGVFGEEEMVFEKLAAKDAAQLLELLEKHRQQKDAAGEDAETPPLR